MPQTPLDGHPCTRKTLSSSGLTRLLLKVETRSNSGVTTLPAVSNAKGAVTDVVGYGDLAYSRGNYSMTLTIPGVPMPIEEQGKFVQIYRKQADGSWKMTREIYNSDLPLPTQPPPQP